MAHKAESIYCQAVEEERCPHCRQRVPESTVCEAAVLKHYRIQELPGGGACASAFLTSSQVMMMPLVQGHTSWLSFIPETFVECLQCARPWGHRTETKAAPEFGNFV